MPPIGQPDTNALEARNLRVLHIEDSEDDATLLMRELRRDGYHVHYTRVETRDAMTAALAQHSWDLILTDYNLPRFSALEALAVLKESGLDLPLIIVSGAIGEETAVAALKAGAHDCIMKSNLTRLLSTVERELREAAVRRQHAHAQEALHNLVEALQRADRLKSEFAATMSHELRTPLSVIIGYTGLLLEGEFGPLDAAQREPMQHIDRAARELCDLVNATLDLSRLEKGLWPLQLQPVSPADLLDEIDGENPEWRTKPGVRCLREVSAQMPPFTTDRTKLKVVLKNLIGNAVKFTDAGTVTVATSQGDGRIEIRVTDTGIGILPEILPIIFEPFRQGVGSMTRRYGGVGLGLYLVRRLLDQLDGTITVDTAVGHGSTFRVRLPIGPESDRNDAPTSSHERGNTHV